MVTQESATKGRNGATKIDVSMTTIGLEQFERVAGF